MFEMLISTQSIIRKRKKRSS